MRIKSPVGEYDFQVTALRLRGGRLEVDGKLGMWETTTVLGPRDWGTLAAGAGALVVLGALLGRRGRPGR
jgi:hypothetical protein